WMLRQGCRTPGFGLRCGTSPRRGRDMTGIARIPMLLCLLPLTAWGGDVPGGGIDADRLATHLGVLASDAFEGRAPTTVGEDRTVAYVSEQFAAAGLQPAGDDGGWTQQVTLARSTIAGPVQAQWRVGGAVREL